MIRKLIERRLAGAERELGAGSLDYARQILGASMGAFRRFAGLRGLSPGPGPLPPGPYHVARIVASRNEDCGTCLQIEVDRALRAGVEPGHVRVVLGRDPGRLPEDLADAYRFAESVAAATWDEGEFREWIRARHGEAGLVELALAIAAARSFPVIKRALGHAVSCRNVEIRA
jgi:hypothetical protein